MPAWETGEVGIMWCIHGIGVAVPEAGRGKDELWYLTEQ